MTEARAPYATITASYWAFTLTDGALRTLVLFHLHALGYSPIEVVSLFLFYEAFGVVTSYVGGYVGARFGLRRTLVIGLALQALGCGLLASFADALSVTILLVAQALSGVAKDLTKMSAKSYVKLLVRDGEGSRLLRLVALLTGSKNALKGVGLLLGGVLLQTVGFRAANLGMAVVMLGTLVAARIRLPPAAGRAASPIAWRGLFAKDRRIRWLSIARAFLFGSRDVWFVFALPVFLAGELGWSAAGASAFLAVWVIGYGIVQAMAPRWTAAERPLGERAADVTAWTALLLVPLGALLLALSLQLEPLAVMLVTLLGVFGAVFATDSTLHSFLIVAYAGRDRVAADVGFYYSANAVGRLVGTLLSGLLFQVAGGGRDGLAACLLASVVMVLASAWSCRRLREPSAPVASELTP